MKYKLISCEVLEREIKHCLQNSAVDFDIEYTKKSAHDKPELLRVQIQDIIDRSIGYDAVLLGFGLCGNAINGLKSADSTLVVPKAHDCCTLFLGSKTRFNELFDGRESMPWSSTGYCEKDGDYLRTSDTGSIIGYDRTYEQYVEEYGEENAEYIWKTIHPERESKDVMFINIPETYDHSIFERFEAEMKDEGKVITVENGHLGLVEKMLNGDWNNDFLVIQPGNEVSAVYDREEIINCRLV